MKTGDVLRERYTIERIVRAGGMGAIYLARDGNLANSLCAVKQMLDLGAESAEYLRSKFDAEMRSLVQLQHPGIPRVRDFFADDQSVFIVMDYIEGENLEDERAQLPGGVFLPQQAVGVVLEVLDVLVYMHSQEAPIIHRDIKPANLIREARTQKIMVVDFGLARAREGMSPQTSVGTPGFCAPEQVMGQAAEASDVFAVGVTLHCFVTGLIPGFGKLANLKESMPEYDADLAAIIEKATTLDASGRIQTAVEMRTALKDWSASRKARLPSTALKPEAASEAKRRVTQSEKFRAMPHNRLGLAFVGICVGIILVGLFELPQLIPLPKAPNAGKSPTGSEIPDLGIEGPVFSSRGDGDERQVTLGEDLGLMWVSAAGGLTAEQRSQEIVKRLNGWYHYRCSNCGSLLLEPSGIVIGKVADETVLFYAHWHGDAYAVPPFLIATIDSKLAQKTGAGSPKFVAAHWRDLMRDVVGMSRGLRTVHSSLGTQLAPVMGKLKALPPGNTLASNLKVILSELTSEQTRNLRDAFKSVPADLKVKPDQFPKHPKFVPLTS